MLDYVRCSGLEVKSLSRWSRPDFLTVSCYELMRSLFELDQCSIFIMIPSMPRVLEIIVHQIVALFRYPRPLLVRLTTGRRNETQFERTVKETVFWY